MSSNWVKIGTITGWVMLIVFSAVLFVGISGIILDIPADRKYQAYFMAFFGLMGLGIGLILQIITEK